VLDKQRIELQKTIDANQQAMANSNAATQQATLEQCAGVIDKHLKQVNGRVDQVEARVESLQTAHHEQGERLSKLEKTMDQVSQQLVLANKDTVTREDIDSDVFDRPAVPNVLRLSARRFINKSAVVEAISPWLIDVCQIDQERWKITGGDSGRDFLIKFQGSELVGARLVNQAMAKIKKDDGTFYKFSATRVDGNEETFRVDRDENAKSRTQRRMGACFLKAFKELHPTIEEIHTRKDHKKGRVSAFVGPEGLCTFEPKSSTVTRDAFLWNLLQVSEMAIDKEAIIAKVMPLFLRPEDNIEWCL
jgi:hypothetical protein